MAKKENEEAKTPGPLASFDAEPFELWGQASDGSGGVMLYKEEWVQKEVEHGDQRRHAVTKSAGSEEGETASNS